MTAADAGGVPPECRTLPLVEATREALVDFGIFVGDDVACPGLPIPFYEGSVVEGHNLPFEYTGRAVIRTARISRRGGDVRWLERHLGMTQLFVGLGAEPFVMVLGPPTQGRGLTVPRLDELRAFHFRAGQGVLIHRGTWHDFPMACRRAVTVLTANSEEVVETLAHTPVAAELDAGDVFKIDVKRRLGVRLVVALTGASGARRGASR
jgi:ureidoglycolate lyase